MNHLDERAIHELRDGALLDADARAHMEHCEVCQAALADAEARAASIDQALSRLDQAFDLESAKEAVRARMEAGKSGASSGGSDGWWSGGWTLGKAAALVLLAAGGAAALPGSPIRSWLAEPEPRPEAVFEALEPITVTERVGGRMTVGEGPLVVALDGVAPGTEVEVAWVEGSAVTVQAASGTAFSYAADRVQATIAGGPVTVHMPRSADPVSLVVNGRTYLTGGAEGFTTEVATEARTDARVRFRVPAG